MRHSTRREGWPPSMKAHIVDVAVEREDPAAMESVLLHLTGVLVVTLLTATHTVQNAIKKQAT